MAMTELKVQIELGLTLSPFEHWSGVQVFFILHFDFLKHPAVSLHPLTNFS